MKKSLTRAELHSHSIFSDGVFAPEDLAERLAAACVEVWSLTDHDTCEGCARASVAASNLGIEFINGIEMSAFDGRSIHVLGYGVDPEKMLGYSTKRLALRDERMQQMIDRLAEFNVVVDPDIVARIAGEGAVARPHLAKAMVEQGFVKTVGEAFDLWLGNSGPAYIETPWPSVPEACEIIAAAGGTAVLAHPGIYDRDERIADWVDAGLQGIEAGHPRHTDKQEKNYRAIAEKLDVFTTSSSDYHGPDNTGADRFGNVEVSRELIDTLLA